MQFILRTFWIFIIWLNAGEVSGQEKQQGKIAIDFAALPFDQSLETVRGDGSKKIAVFYEIDCSYCKALEKYELSRLNDVTIYNFIFVNNTKDSPSWRKAEAIWCASDVQKAWSNFIRKDYLAHNIKSCESPLYKNKVLASQLGVKGTPTLFFINGSKAVGFLNAKEIEQRFLDANFYND